MADKPIPEMVERVAKAITPNWEHASYNERRNAIITARAAIKMMREPPDLRNYIEHINETIKDGDFSLHDIWRIMIDAALGE